MTTRETAQTRRGSGTALATRPLWGFRTVDLVVTAAIGVAFGVAFLGYGQLYILLDPVTAVYPPSVGILAGIWFLPAVLAAVIVRRPGAALLAELLAAFVSMALGGQWGMPTMISGLLQGLGVELVFAALAYRRFAVWVAMLGGMCAAVPEWFYERNVYYPEWSSAHATVLLVLFLISGALLAGVLGRLLAGALARTGALDAFPIGRESAQERAV
ncbi:MAG: ECF transporter S component [Brachybacterium sp.]|nr:ECF transporter S component [Brachybacterium sp.]